MMVMVDELKVVDVLEGVASSYAALGLYTRPGIISSASSYHYIIISSYPPRLIFIVISLFLG